MGESYEIDSAEPLRSGRVRPVFEFDYDGGGSHKGATGSIIVNGKKVGTGRIEKTMGHCTHWPPKPQTSATTATYPPSRSQSRNPR